MPEAIRRQINKIKMEKLDSLVNELNSLNENELDCLNGGYTSASLTGLDGKSIELNFYQCHCGKSGSSK